VYLVFVQPFGAAPGAMVSYGVAPQAYPGAPPQQQYGAPPQQQQNYSQSAGTPFDSQAQGGVPPPSVNTAPTSITPRAQASPSTLGFGSPQPDFTGFGTPAQAPAPTNDFAYGASPAQAPANNDFAYNAPPAQAPINDFPFGAAPTQAPANNFTGQYGAPPAQAPANNFAGQYGAPPANDFAGQYGAPPADNQFGAPPPAQQEGPVQEQAAPAPGPTLSMNALHGQNDGLLDNNNGSAPAAAKSLADQAYAKFASMDQFDLVSKKDTDRQNPFEVAPVGAQKSLSDMKKSTSVGFSRNVLFRFVLLK